ncbi:hypothetical protein [Streptomyces sp. NBC_01443]|uniref:hypothetical protein n=1 Tax=Streptomyces sp. NBC_01443 TaxID=2903868 RepID=UPI00224CB343|nr:hypothetical protein [Streptomyces sp. NBC_01443]MCX4626057.1 hypothetical protein [Streptomyces sp. NBC_01443]
MEALTAAMGSVLSVGHEDYLGHLDEFAAAAELVASADLAFVAGRQRPEELVERVVVGTVLGDAMLVAMRRLAQVDASARRYPPQAPESSSGSSFG